ncbi:MAG TPA: response regulator transcription factor [Acidimicrobiia bacterium]
MPDTAETPPEVRILLVDDHQVVRSGLKALIELEEDLVVIGEAGTAAEAIEMVDAVSPDLVVLDVRLPDRSGISVCQEITTHHPEVKVLILTSYADEIALAAAMAARASGFVLKNVRASELVTDIRRVMGGEMVALGQFGDDSPELALLTVLSPQERAVADHLAEGLTNREIADHMGLAEKTVKNYVSNVLTKLGMARRSEAAAHVARIQAMTEAPLVGRPPERVTTSPRRTRATSERMARVGVPVTFDP